MFLNGVLVCVGASASNGVVNAAAGGNGASGGSATPSSTAAGGQALLMTGVKLTSKQQTLLNSHFAGGNYYKTKSK